MTRGQARRLSAARFNLARGPRGEGWGSEERDLWLRASVFPILDELLQRHDEECAKADLRRKGGRR